MNQAISTEQPRPKKNQHQPSWGLVLRDLEARGEMEVISDIGARNQAGIQKYGTALQPHNGRDSLQDAYEESMDLVVYLKNAIQELPPLVPPSEGHRHLSRLYHQAIGIMCALKDYRVKQEADRAAFEEARAQKVQKMIPVVVTREEAFRTMGIPDPRKPQDAPVAPVPTVWVDDQVTQNQAHTGHPGVFEGMVGVEVASHQPTVFIPPQIQGPLREELEDWKARMDASLQAERERHHKAVTRGDGKLHSEWGEFS
jgi:hypothetical protein